MVAKPEGYVAAKNISDYQALSAVKSYQLGGPLPVDELATQGYPRRVAKAKLHKLQKRGWVTLTYKLLPKGVEVLCDEINGKAEATHPERSK